MLDAASVQIAQRTLQRARDFGLWKETMENGGQKAKANWREALGNLCIVEPLVSLVKKALDLGLCRSLAVEVMTSAGWRETLRPAAP